MVDVSVIVACLNGQETLAEALESLTAQAWDGAFEILLADNGSTDASAAIFAEHARRHPHLRMRRVDASAERGKAAALNAGLAAAEGRAFLFVDCDDGKFMNHSDRPNTDFRIFDRGYALVDIFPGDELTCSYFEFDPDFRGFGETAIDLSISALQAESFRAAAETRP